MDFQPIGYLEWMKDHFGRYKFDLANPAVRPLTLSDLGITLKDLGLTGSNYQGDPELVKSISARFDVSPDSVVLTDSASMGIALVCLALMKSGDQVLLEAPNYEPLYRLPESIGCDVRMLDRPFEKGFQIDVEGLQRRISRSTKAVVLTNLHNPSGVATDPAKMKSICQVSRDHGAVVVVSEVFRDLKIKGEAPSPVFKLDRTAVSIGSLAKLYGLDGLRVGWVLCNEDFARRLKQIRNHLTVMGPFLTERITVIAFKQLDRLLARTRGIVSENLPILREFVEKRDDLDWVEPDGGTIAFLRLRRGIPSWSFAKFLHENYSTLVVPGDFFWAKGFVRVGFGGDSENLKKGLANFGEALAEWRRAGHASS